MFIKSQRLEDRTSKKQLVLVFLQICISCPIEESLYLLPTASLSVPKYIWFWPCHFVIALTSMRPVNAPPWRDHTRIVRKIRAAASKGME
jgi:hypothetical protein